MPQQEDLTQGFVSWIKKNTEADVESSGVSKRKKREKF
jgi:hypothetical protein